MDLYRILLLVLLGLPAVAVAVVALLGPRRASLVRQVCLAVTLVDAVLACVLAFGFLEAREAAPLKDNAATFRPEFVPGSTAASPHTTTWDVLDLGKGAVQFYIGLDGLNIWLVVLTTFLMVAAVLCSWNSIEERVNEYHAWLLMLGVGMLGVFLAFDILLFYVFFELTLVPLFFLIGIWGGSERRHAARKFFIYTLAGSVITFLGLLAVVVACWHMDTSSSRKLTFAIPELIATFQRLLMKPNQTAGDIAFWQSFQFWVFLAMMVGFAVKVPLVPVHTWLPLAHVEAPTAGSVLLAGVLLKMGTYGFLRLCLPLTPDACISIGVPLIGTLSVIGILYGAMCAKAQDDIKKLVAYSSVSHLGFCTLGMFALNTVGISGSLLQMINHGLSTGGLFLVVGMLYERYHTRQISDYSGIGSRLGKLTACMVFFCLSSVGLPGLNGFVGEALVFFGMFREHPVMAVLGAGGIILGAWYLMSMLRSVFFGPLKEPHHEGEGHVQDLNPREAATLAPIMALCLLLGVYPQFVLDSITPDVRVVTILYDRKMRRPIATETPPPAPMGAPPRPVLMKLD